MANQTTMPGREEMEVFVEKGANCLDCAAPDCTEMTPEGMDVCADMPFWNGRPITRAMLREWQVLLRASAEDNAL